MFYGFQGKIYPEVVDIKENHPFNKLLREKIRTFKKDNNEDSCLSKACR